MTAPFFCADYQSADKALGLTGELRRPPVGLSGRRKR